MDNTKTIVQDFGNGVVSAVSVDDNIGIPMELIEEVYKTGINIVPKLVALAKEHLDRFTPEERYWLNVVSEM